MPGRGRSTNDGPALTGPRGGLDRRTRLLVAGVEVVEDGGLAALTHRAVSSRAGLPPASAGHYFATKDDLVESVLLHHVTTRLSRIVDVLQASISGVDDVEDLPAVVASKLVSGETGVSLVQYELYIEATRRPQIRAAVTSAIAAVVSVARPLMEEMGVRDPELAARAIVAVADGLALHRLTVPLPPEQDRDMTARVLTGVVLAFLADD